MLVICTTEGLTNAPAVGRLLGAALNRWHDGDVGTLARRDRHRRRKRRRRRRLVVDRLLLEVPAEMNTLYDMRTKISKA